MLEFIRTLTLILVVATMTVLVDRYYDNKED